MYSPLKIRYLSCLAVADVINELCFCSIRACVDLAVICVDYFQICRDAFEPDLLSFVIENEDGAFIAVPLHL